MPAGRRSGKTELAKRVLVKQLPIQKEWDNPNYFFGAPTLGQAVRIAWDDLKALTPKPWIDDISEGGKCIKTIFGSRLWVFGLDSPQRVEGTPWDFCILDESSDLDPTTFDRVVYPALADRNGGCWRIGVPKRRGIGAEVFRMAFEAALTGDDPQSEAFTWPSADILPVDVIEHAKRTLDEKTFREQFEASWESAGGLVYYAFDRKRNVKELQYNAALPLRVGSDFNVDPMAWVVCQVINGEVHVLDEIWLRDTNTAEALSTLWHRWGHHKSSFEFYGDASGQSRHTSTTESDYQQILGDSRFRASGRRVHYPRQNPHVSDRYAAVNSMLCSMKSDVRLLVDPKCVNLIRDLSNLAYKEGVREAEGGGDRTHITDALGYLVHYMFPVSASRMLEEAGEKRKEARFGV